MGERERFRLTQGLFAAASQLSAAFENEIGVLPAVFGHDWDDIEKSIRLDDWSNFRKRWEVWNVITSYSIHYTKLYDFGGPVEPLAVNERRIEFS